MKMLRLPSSEYSLREIAGEGEVVAFNVGPDGEAYLVLALEPLDYRTESNGFATFAKTVPSAPQRYRVLALRGGDIELDVAIDSEQFNIHDIQPFADGLLLACSRSEYRGPNNFDLNGRVYLRDGTFIRALLLGDGLETIQATRRGELWASYFDEGIFGNYGWQRPVGASGLLAWSEQGEKLYDYEAPGMAGAISDCYALNVASDEDVWCYYYTEFPLVHLHNKRVASTWNIPVAGSHAFAVSAGYALFAGGYKASDAFHLVRLGADGVATLLRQFELRDASGAIVKMERVVGRRGTLHVLGGGVLYETTLDDVLKEHGR